MERSIETAVKACRGTLVRVTFVRVGEGVKPIGDRSDSSADGPSGMLLRKAQSLVP